MSKGIDDLLNEYSSSEDEGESNLRYSNSAVDRLLDSDDEDDVVQLSLTNRESFSRKEGVTVGSGNKEEKAKLSDQDLIEKLIASNDSSDDEGDGKVSTSEAVSTGSTANKSGANTDGFSFVQRTARSSSSLRGANMGSGSSSSNSTTSGSGNKGSTSALEGVMIIADEIKAKLTMTTAANATHQSSIISNKNNSSNGINSSKYMGGKADTLELAERNETRHLEGGNTQMRSPLRLTQLKREGGSSSAAGQQSRLALKLGTIAAITNQLERNALYKHHGPGAATAIHVCDSGFFVGTANGSVLIFNRKHEIRKVLGSSSQDAGGNVEAAAAVGGAGGAGVIKDPVTFIDVAARAGILATAHASGQINLWDLAKGEVIYIVRDIHTTNITYLKVLTPLGSGGGDTGAIDPATGEPTSAAANFHTVSVDGKGQIYRGRYVKGLGFGLGVFNSYNAEFDCLLNGNAGVVSRVCVCPALHEWRDSFHTEDEFSTNVRDEATSKPSQSAAGSSSAAAGSGSGGAKGPLDDVQLLAFNTASRSYVVLLQPHIQVVFKWAAPALANRTTTQQPQLPGTATGTGTVSGHDCALTFSWAKQQTGGRYVPALVRAHGDKAEKLTIDLLTAIKGQAGTSAAFTFTASPSVDVRALAGTPRELPEKDTWGQAAEKADSERIVAVKCVEKDRLAFITHAAIFLLAHDLRFVDRYELSSEVGRSLASATVRVAAASTTNTSTGSASGEGGGGVKAWMHLHNSSLYLLSATSLSRLHMQGWHEQCEQLVAAGNWLEALSVAVDAWDKQGGASAVTALSAATEIADTQERDSELGHMSRLKAQVESYILRYVELSLGRNSGSTGGGGGGGSGGAGAGGDHHLLVSEVALDYCASIDSLPLLFGPVYAIHKRAQLQLVFFDALEPYILKGLVPSLPSDILKDFVETYSRNQRVTSMERCLLHLSFNGGGNAANNDSDVDFVSLFCLQRSLYSGFLHACASGSGDYSGTLLILFERLGNISSPSTPVSAATGGYSHANPEGMLSPETVEAVFKALLFIQAVSAGKTFPRGRSVERYQQQEQRRQLLSMMTTLTTTAQQQSQIQAQAQVLDVTWRRRFPELYSYFQSTRTARLRAAALVGSSTDGQQQQQQQQQGGFAVLELLLRVDRGAAVKVVSQALTRLGEALSSPSSPSSPRGGADTAAVSAVAGSSGSSSPDSQVVLAELHRHFFTFAQGRPANAEVLSLYFTHSATHLAASPSLVLPWDLVKALLEHLHTVHPIGSGRLKGETLVCQLARNQTPRAHLLSVTGGSGSGSGSVSGGSESTGDASAESAAATVSSSSAITRCSRELLSAVLSKLNFWRAALLIGLPDGNSSVVGDVTQYYCALLQSALTHYVKPQFKTEFQGEGRDSSSGGGSAGVAEIEQQNQREEEEARALLVSFVGDCFEAAGDEATAAGALGAILAKFIVPIAEVAGTSVAETVVVRYLLDSIPLVITCTAGSVSVQLAVLAAAVAAAASVDDPATAGATNGAAAAINSTGKELSLAHCFTPQTLMVYFRLLVTHQPRDVYAFLLSGTPQRCGLDELECLRTCREAGVTDAMALLLERGGDCAGACALLMESAGKCLTDAKAEIEGDDYLLSSARGLLMNLDDSQAYQEAQSGLRSLVSHATLEHTVDCVIGLCLRTSQAASAKAKDHNTPDVDVEREKEKGRTLWFTVCDRLLQDRLALRDPGAYSTSSELVGLMLVAQLQRVLAQMKTAVATRDITRNIFASGQHKHKEQQGGSNSGGGGGARTQLGDFKAIMVSMVRSAQEDTVCADIMGLVSTRDLYDARCKELSMKTQGVRLDPGQHQHRRHPGGDFLARGGSESRYFVVKDEEGHSSRSSSSSSSSYDYDGSHEPDSSSPDSSKKTKSALLKAGIRRAKGLIG
jgi:hypothetical protein